MNTTPPQELKFKALFLSFFCLLSVVCATNDDDAFFQGVARRQVPKGCYVQFYRGGGCFVQINSCPVISLVMNVVEWSSFFQELPLDSPRKKDTLSDILCSHLVLTT